MTTSRLQCNTARAERSSEQVSDSDDRRYIAQALALARRGLNTTDPNPRVGCILVKGDRVIGRGWHRYAGGAHAEVDALASASESAAGATCYVSLEPCCHTGKTGPCTEALIAAGVRRVVAAMPDPNPLVAGRGVAALEAAGIETQVGVLTVEAEALNPGFCYRFKFGRPYIRLKLGLSLDGRSAMASGESQWITSAQARQDVQRWRARSSAILTGINTVLADDPSLNVRETGVASASLRQPVRVILDSCLRTPEAARLLSLPGRTWIFTANADVASRSNKCWPEGVEVITTDSKAQVDLLGVVQELASREINELWIEAGPTLTGAFLQSGLVDELVLYVAPGLMGHDARPALRLHNLMQLSDRLKLEFTDVRRIGPDLRITACLIKEASTCSPV